jgi:tRNA1Val (adenine37-N6)-methyltransferase
VSASRDELEARRRALEEELGEAVTVDGLTGSWSILQRKHGHRHSTDDVLTAWYALEESAGVTRGLDLGTGIGTVGLLVLWGLGPLGRVTGVEAQDVSFRLLRENVVTCGVEDRFRPLHGDLRELDLGERFPLITGSPPYFDVSAGIVPADAQKAHARFELRGHVGDYARAARRHLAEGGRFVFCFPWPQRQRAIDLVRAEGFQIDAHRDVVPRAARSPLFSVFACTVGEAPTAEAEAPLVVRDEAGELTAAMRAVRRRFGWP